MARKDMVLWAWGPDAALVERDAVAVGQPSRVPKALEHVVMA
jgi:hypothetical protein